MRVRYFLLALVASLSCLLLSAAPGQAQFGLDNLPLSNILDDEVDISAPPLPIVPSAVRLDGRFLFRTAAVDGISAEARAKEISHRLQTYAAQHSSEVIDWRTDPGTNQPIIFTGDQFLMTVTSADVALAGATPVNVRADELKAILTEALDYYQYERQPDVVQQRLRWAGGLLLLMVFLSRGLFFFFFLVV